MEKLYYDLHLHSCLSPCGDELMTPGNIVGLALINKLDIIALTDHNSCKNCPAFMSFADKYGILAIPGMELTTSEEVHVICLFPTLEKALAFDKYVYSSLLPLNNKEDIFGSQVICDLEDNPSSKEELLLINATSISFDEVFDVVNSYGGVAFPAHIDKSSNSVISNLGFISPDSKFSTYELADLSNKEALEKSNPFLSNCLLLKNSDAHTIADISERDNYLEVEERSVTAFLDLLK